MKKLLLLCLIMVTFNISPRPNSHRTLQQQYNTGHFVLNLTNNNFITFIGASSRLMNRAGEIIAAQNDAARRVAQFYEISGQVEHFHSHGSGLFDFDDNFFINIDNNEADYSHFVNLLTFNAETNVFHFNRGTIVYFQYDTQHAPINFASSVNRSGRPFWVERSNFTIEGYRIAVGFARNREWLRDTITRASEAAMAKLLMEVATDIETSVTELSNNTLNSITLRSFGTLHGFRIIELWIDPANGSVYVLAIAKIN